MNMSPIAQLCAIGASAAFCAFFVFAASLLVVQGINRWSPDVDTTTARILQRERITWRGYATLLLLGVVFISAFAAAVRL